MTVSLRSHRFRPSPVLVAAACLAALLAGCSTPYQRPELHIPAGWQHAPGAARDADAAARAMVQADHWWTAFGDPQLDALIALALERNNDLAAATYKVRNAQLAVGNAFGNRLPTFNANASANASKNLGNNGATTTTLPDGTIITDTSSNQWSKNFGTSLGVSWVADLWGNLASQQRMAEWEAAATEQDRQATAMALTGTVATTYWQLAVARHKLASQQDSVARATRTLRLAQTQYDAGAISGLDLAQARQTLASQEAQLAALQQQIVELRNALAILFDGPPEQLPPAAQSPRLPDLAHLPAVPAGVPADVLARRPDLRAAELRLREALANVDATRTSYYPVLNLTAGLGTGSSTLSGILKNPALTLGAGLALPFLNFGTMQRNVRISQNSYEQAIVTFRQTLYKALADVENALSNRTQLAQQTAQLQVAAQQAARAEELTGVRYRAGAVALKIWLDAQESRRAAELTVQDAQLARATNLVTLYQALGGRPLVAPVSAAATPATTTAAAVDDARTERADAAKSDAAAAQAASVPAVPR